MTAYALSLLVLAGCTSWEHVPHDANYGQIYEPGDLARIERQDGNTFEFEVSEAGEDYVAGEGMRFEKGEVVAI